MESNSVRKSVREHYGKVASLGGGCGCTTGCCSVTPEAAKEEHGAVARSEAIGYSAVDIHSVPDEANLGLGCGNPLAIASLKPGQTVLDLGSGAGFDAFLAAKAVGPTGRVIGVDMTAEMVSKARQNRAKGDYENVEFRLGEIENLPVADGSVDVILSNCVVNLSPDKAKVFREAFRVLKRGGRLAISDIVATTPMPENIRNDLELYAACIAGTLLIGDVQAILRAAGFADICVEPNPQSRDVIRDWFPGRGIEEYVVSATIQAVKPGGTIMVSERQDQLGMQNELQSRNPTCGPCDDDKCCCQGNETPRSKTVIFAAVMFLAVGMAAYSMLKKNGAIAPAVLSTSARNAIAVSDGLEEIPLESLEAAEKLATQQDVTFLLLPGGDVSLARVAQKQVSVAFGKLFVQGQTVAAFRVPESAGAYSALSRQFRVDAYPCVIVLGNGGQLSVISGEITETKLLRAAVMAGLRSNCCPSVGGSCCPTSSSWSPSRVLPVDLIRRPQAITDTEDQRAGMD